MTFLLTVYRNATWHIQRPEGQHLIWCRQLGRAPLQPRFIAHRLELAQIPDGQMLAGTPICHRCWAAIRVHLRRTGGLSHEC